MKFPYKAKMCFNKEACQEAIAYYDSVRPQVQTTEVHNYDQCVEAIKEKLADFKTPRAKTPTIPIGMDRLSLYHLAIRCSVDFLKPIPDGTTLDKLYYTLVEALRLTGEEWNSTTMYSDISTFKSAYNQSEKCIQFVHNILMSGLHERKSIIHLINQFIKLINVLHLKDILCVDLPSKRILHDISFTTMQDFKY